MKKSIKESTILVCKNMASAVKVQEVDGSYHEGGGQILRIATALSVLTQTAIRVNKIRAGRSKPGLLAQHLKGLEAVQSICNGRLENAALGSTEVTLYPGQITGGEYSADTHTAGSITLLVQVTLPCALFSDSAITLKFRGGTNTEMAPQLDYLTEVFRPTLEKFGVSFDYKLIKRGYYPRGGGEVHFRILPVPLVKPVILVEQGTIEKIYGWAFVAGSIPIKIADTMVEAATHALHQAFADVKVNIESYKENADEAFGNGSGINIVARTSTGVILGGSALGKKELRPEEVGKNAAKDLIDAYKSGACVDKYSQDQIIIFMAIAYGGSEVMVGPLSEHTKTAIHVCELLTEARFSIVNRSPTCNIIQCVGQGLKNKHIS